MRTEKNRGMAGRLALILAGVGLVTGGAAFAQRDYGDGSDGYQVGESGAPPPASKPVERVARFDYVSGNVTWRVNDGAAWTRAKTNQALQQGDQIWVTDGGRAEVRFDDGSVLRLGNGAIVTLQTVYADAQGDYTQVKMQAGLLTICPRSERSVFEVNGPYASLKAAGPGRVRVGIGEAFEVSVRTGQATVDSDAGKTRVNSGEYVLVRDTDTTYHIQNLPGKDSWEAWNDDRDRLLTTAPPPVRTAHYPAPSPRTSVYFSLDFFTGGYHHHGWDGRGEFRYRR